MTHHHNTGHGLGLLGLVAAIAFAFGERTARIVVGGALIGVPLAVVIFLWVYGP